MDNAYGQWSCLSPSRSKAGPVHSIHDPHTSVSSSRRSHWFCGHGALLETERIEEARKLLWQQDSGFGWMNTRTAPSINLVEMMLRGVQPSTGCWRMKRSRLYSLFEEDMAACAWWMASDDALSATPKWICIQRHHHFARKSSATEYPKLALPHARGSSFCSPEAREQTFRALKGENIDQECGGSENDLIGSAEGILKGGNLSVLYSLLGSADLPDMQGAVLFIEEIV